MTHLPLLLPEVRYSPEEVERDSAGTPKSLATILVAGGALAALPGVDLPLPARVAAHAGGLACASLGILSFKAPVPWLLAARRRPAGFASACYVAALGSTALGGGDKSPAYFPAVLLTAVGTASVGNPSRAALPGAGVAAGYLLGAAVWLRHGGSLTPQRLAVAIAHAVAFPASSMVGAIAGRLTFRNRVLSDYVARERDAASTGADRSHLDAVIAEVGRRSAQVTLVLEQIAREYADDPDVPEATREMNTAMATIRSAQVRLTAADEREPLAGWTRLTKAVAEYNERPGAVRTELMLEVGDREQVSANTIDTLIRCANLLIPNAAEAGHHRDAPVTATVRIYRQRDSQRAGWGRETAELIVMEIEDDAGGTTWPSKNDWGRGLRECEQRADELDGNLRLQIGRAGLRPVIELPWTASDLGDAARALTLSRRYVDDLERCFVIGRIVTSVQAAFFTAGRVGVRRIDAVIVAAVLGASELSRVYRPGPARTIVQGALGVAMMSSLGGPQRPPAGGYAALVPMEQAASGSFGTAAAVTAAQAAASLLRAGPARWQSDDDGALADRLFTLIGLASGRRHIDRAFSAAEARGRARKRDLATTDAARPRRARARPAPFH